MANGSATETNAAGVWVVGYSHYCVDEACSDVTYPFPISRDDGRELLNADMAVRFPSCFPPFCSLYPLPP